MTVYYVSNQFYSTAHRQKNRKDNKFNHRIFKMFMLLSYAGATVVVVVVVVVVIMIVVAIAV